MEFHSGIWNMDYLFQNSIPKTWNVPIFKRIMHFQNLFYYQNYDVSSSKSDFN